jgi:nucleoside-diphosphate-sugar epimerase
MKILVVGGAGYVGSILVPKLFNLGYDVDVIDLLWFGNNLPQTINVIKKDAFNITEEELKQYEQVIFIAGLSNDPMAEFSPQQNFIQNSALPSYLAYISKQAKVKRFIFASSCSIYGYANDKIYNETDITFSTYPYGISKIQSEFVIKNICDENFSTICLRKGTISGYSPRMRFDLVINTMFKSAMLTNEIIVNDPNAWRPILGIEDAADAYIKSIQAPYEISGIFNVASNNYTILEIATILKNILEEKYNFNNINIQIKNIPDLRSYKVNSDLGKSILNLKYLNDIENIVDSIVTYNNFDNINYYNIEVFKKLKL